MGIDADNEGFKLLSKLFILLLTMFAKDYTQYVLMTQGTQVTYNTLYPAKL